jgi:hypothetical protein
MNWLMIGILILLTAIVAAAMIAALRVMLMPRAVTRSELFQYVRRGEGGFSKLLAVPLLVWAALFLLLLVLLVFVAGVALMYVFALLHGEWFQLLDSLPKTAGNVVVHLIYPLQMLLLSLTAFLLAVGGFQIVFGPVKQLDRFGLAVRDVVDLARKLAGLLAFAAGLEVIKLLFYSLLVPPEQLDRFFARDTLPKADPFGAALLVAAILTALAAWWRRGREPR